MDHRPDGRIVLVGSGVAATLVALALWPPGASTSARVPPSNAGRHQATPSPGALADLQAAWHYGHWWNGFCLLGSQPRVLTLTVTNAGSADAGPFIVQDGGVQWTFSGLGGGQTTMVMEWGNYPDWPLVVDAHDQVPESDEANNRIAPPAEATWTPTFVAARSKGTPRPPAGLDPVPLSTLPHLCTPIPPAPTLTPAGPPPLADLEVAAVSWDRQLVRAADGSGPCWPLDRPWRLVVTIRNRGDRPATWFSVRGGYYAATWQVQELAAGATLTLTSEPRFLPADIRVDADGHVEESREDNNIWTAPPAGTPTPEGTAPAYCAATPTRATPTPTSTATRSPTRPTATGTPPPPWLFLPAAERRR
jgi:hypothetical protein